MKKRESAARSYTTRNWNKLETTSLLFTAEPGYQVVLVESSGSI